jgi:hypothetical protein
MVQAPEGGYTPGNYEKPWMGPYYFNAGGQWPTPSQSKPWQAQQQTGNVNSNSNLLRNLSGDSRNVATALIQLFQQFGLGSLASRIIEMAKRGLSEDGIYLELQETQEWKARFAGNYERERAGLGMLSPAEYLTIERSYASVLQQYGLPTGFWDDPSDFAKWIGRNVSPGEVESRARMASGWVNSQDNALAKTLRDTFGYSTGDLVAMSLDPSRALPLLEKTQRAISAATAATRQGLTADRGYAEHLADLGVTQEQAEQGYGMIAENLEPLSDLGDIYGITYSQRDLEEDVFEQIGAAKDKRKKLASQERAAFGGSSRGTTGRASTEYGY